MLQEEYFHINEYNVPSFDHSSKNSHANVSSGRPTNPQDLSSSASNADPDHCESLSIADLLEVSAAHDLRARTYEENS